MNLFILSDFMLWDGVIFSIVGLQSTNSNLSATKNSWLIAL